MIDLDYDLKWWEVEWMDFSPPSSCTSGERQEILDDETLYGIDVPDLSDLGY